ncbi:MAG: class I SAM-dependent methyltransferase [Candidatus Omnitrophota bacterium]
MQDDSGVNKIFKAGFVYNWFQNLVGVKRARKWYARNLWKVKAGEKVVDIGCGTGDVLDFLPKNIQYIGFDISEEYVKTARGKFGESGKFLVGAAGDFLDIPENPLSGADLVLCNGMLHHLDDGEVQKVLELSKSILTPSGRMVCVEPAFLMHQTRLSKWLISKDRGKNVRDEKEWNRLIGQVYNNFSTQIITGILRIPYVHIVIECCK